MENPTFPPRVCFHDLFLSLLCFQVKHFLSLLNNIYILYPRRPRQLKKMSPKTAVLTDKAPKPSPFLSQAVIHNGLIYCSGNMGKDPVTGNLVGGGVGERTVSTSTAYKEGSILRFVSLRPSNLSFLKINIRRRKHFEISRPFSKQVEVV